MSTFLLEKNTHWSAIPPSRCINYTLIPCQLGGRMQTLHWLSQEHHYSKHFDFLFLVFTEALWVTERGQIKQHIRYFSSPVALSLEFSLQGFPMQLPPLWLLPPWFSLPTSYSFFCEKHLSPFFTACLCRLRCPKVLKQIPVNWQKSSLEDSLPISSCHLDLTLGPHLSLKLITSISSKQI